MNSTKPLLVSLCLMLVAGVCFAELNAIGKARTLEPNRIDAQTTGQFSTMPESTYTSAVLWQAFSYDDDTNYYGLTTASNDGIITNANVKPAYSTSNGGAQNFDGVDDSVFVASSATLDNIPLKTIAVWIFPETMGGSSGGFLVTKWDGADAGWFFRTLGVAGTTNFAFVQLTTDVTDGQWRTPTESVLLNQWQHVVAVYNNGSVTNDALIYINGIAQVMSESTTPNSAASDDSGVNVSIGRSTGAHAFDGPISDVKMFNRLFASNEVWNLYVYEKGTYGL